MNISNVVQHDFGLDDIIGKNSKSHYRLCITLMLTHINLYFCYHLLSLMLFQTCMTFFFLRNTKEDISNNVDKKNIGVGTNNLVGI